MTVLNNIHIRTCIIIAFIFFLLSCGIEDVSRYLNYSPRSNSVASNALNFLPPQEFEPLFFGIEVCYKIYASKSDADSDANNFENRQNSDLIPGSSILSYLFSPSNLNYQRFILKNTLKIFLITKTEIPSTDSLLTFELNNEKELIFKINNNEIATLYRNLIASPVSFSQKPTTGDNDYKSSNTDTDEEFYIQFYAVSYGFTNLLQPIYSKAKLLGVFTISYN